MAAVAGPAVLSANAALRRALISVLNVQIFHAITDEKGKHSNVFNKAKKERLQEMKNIGVEERIKKQWE